MPKKINLKAIEAEIKRLNNFTDGISDELVKAMDDYQKEYEKWIRKKKFDIEAGKLKKTQKNFNIAQSRDPLTSLGFNKIAIDHIREYNEIAKEQILFNKRIGITTDLKFTDITMLKRLKEIDLANMFAQGSQLDKEVKKQLVNAVALGADFNETVDNLGASLLGVGKKKGRLAAYANTYMRTALFGLGRMIDKDIYDSIGGAEPDAIYLYAGASPDKKIRAFCLARVAKFFTRKQIDEFPTLNGSGLDPYFSPGGWNCRHRMIFLPPNTELFESFKSQIDKTVQ